MLKTYRVPLLEVEEIGRMFLRTPSSVQGLQTTKAKMDEGYASFDGCQPSQH